MQTTAKKSSKYTQKITHVDDMMIHNLVKYLIQTHKKNHTCRWYDDTQSCKISCPNSTSYVRYKNNKFQARKLSKWFVIFISQKRSRVWTRYFTKLCIIISSTCVIFLINLHNFFVIVCTGFHEIVVCTRYVPDVLGTYLVQTTTSWKLMKTTVKKVF